MLDAQVLRHLGFSGSECSFYYCFEPYQSEKQSEKGLVEVAGYPEIPTPLDEGIFLE